MGQTADRRQRQVAPRGVVPGPEAGGRGSGAGREPPGGQRHPGAAANRPDSSQPLERGAGSAQRAPVSHELGRALWRLSRLPGALTAGRPAHHHAVHPVQRAVRSGLERAVPPERVALRRSSRILRAMTLSQPTPEPRRPSLVGGRATRPSIGFPVKLSRWRTFWQAPVPVLITAGAGGEVLVARTRLVLTLLVLLLPLADLLRRPGERGGVYVGLGAALLGVALAAIALRLARKRVYTPPIGFATSLLDVTLVTAVLVMLLALGQPLSVVSSRVAFLVYFLAIAAAALRFDPRICAVTGAVAMVEYAAVALLGRGLAGGATEPVIWIDQVSRLALLGIAGLLSTTLVLRTRELQWLSARDKLTGFLNRGIFDDLLNDASLRARRYGRPLSILMLDVDRFKRFNDTWGHAAGDEALKAVSAAIKQSVRQGEIVARYGGDEFVVLFPETRPETAVQRGEKIRLRIPPIIAGRRGRQQAVPVTISVGVASLPADGVDGLEVLNQADMRLYEAKHAGRDAVVGPAPQAEPPAAQAEAG